MSQDNDYKKIKDASEDDGMSESDAAEDVKGISGGKPPRDEHLKLIHKLSLKDPDPGAA
jgi:hypothetical protein